MISIIDKLLEEILDGILDAMLDFILDGMLGWMLNPSYHGRGGWIPMNALLDA